MADATDEVLALHYHTRQVQDGFDPEQEAEELGDKEFGTLFRSAYEKKTSASGILDVIPQTYHQKVQGFKSGAATFVGELGMQETEADLMKSARKSATQAARAGKEVFSDVDMIDDFGDFLKYVGQGIARTPVDVGPTIVTSALTRRLGGVAQNIAGKKNWDAGIKKRLGDNYGKNIGMATGALASSTTENTGHVYSELYPYTKLDKDDPLYLSPDDARGLSMMAGSVSGALDSAIPLYLLGKLSKIIGKGPAEEQIGKMFKGMPETMVMGAKGAVGEGFTEGLQEIVQMAAVKHHTGEEWGYKDYNRLINAGIMGAIAGGTMSGGVGLLQDIRNKNTALDPETGDFVEAEEGYFDRVNDRVEIRNRGIESKFDNLEVGSIVKVPGSGRLARVTSKDSEAMDVTVTYEDGLTEKLSPLKVQIKSDARRNLTTDDFKRMSESDLEAFKAFNANRPKVVQAVDAELESRKDKTEDDDSIEVRSTQLKVEQDRNNQLIVTDLSSKERIYSARIREEDGILVLEGEQLDVTDSEREGDSVNMIREQARKYALKEGKLISINGVIVYPSSFENVQSYTQDELIQEYVKISNAYLTYDEEQTEGIYPLLESMEKRLADEGLISFDKKGNPITGKVTTKRNNSAFLKNNQEIGNILAGVAFADVESNLIQYEETEHSANLNRKYFHKKISDIVDSRLEGFSKITAADKKSIINSAADLFSKTYLDDEGKWTGGKTGWDIDVENEERAEEAKRKSQDARTRFDDLDPQPGTFIKLDKDDKWQKITSVDKDRASVKTQEMGDVEISAHAVAKIANQRPIEIGEHRVTEKGDTFLYRLGQVTGSSTNGEHTGRATGLVLNVDQSGKVLSITDSSQRTTTLSPDDEITLDDENLAGAIARKVLPKKEALTPRKVTNKLGAGIVQEVEGDVSQILVSEVEVGSTKTRPKNKLTVKPIVNEDGEVSQFIHEGETFDLSKPYTPREWTNGAREKLLSAGKFPAKPAPAPKARKLATPSGNLTFRTKSQKLIVPSIEYTEIEATEGQDPYDAIIAARRLLKPESIAVGDEAKAGIALRYHDSQLDQPAILVRRLTENKDGEVIISNMTRAANQNSRPDRISPLEGKAGGALVVGGDLFAPATDATADIYIEPIGVFEIEEGAKFDTAFSSEEAFNESMGVFRRYSRIRKNTLTIEKEVAEEINDPAKKQTALLIREAISDEKGDFNPYLEVYAPGMKGKAIQNLKEAIGARALAKGFDKNKAELGEKIFKSKKPRIHDIREFLEHISTTMDEKTGAKWKQGLAAVEKDPGQFKEVSRAIDLFLRESQTGGKQSRKEIGEGDALSKAVSTELVKGVNKGSGGPRDTDTEKIDGEYDLADKDESESKVEEVNDDFASPEFSDDLASNDSNKIEEKAEAVPPQEQEQKTGPSEEQFPAGGLSAEQDAEEQQAVIEEASTDYDPAIVEVVETTMQGLTLTDAERRSAGIILSEYKRGKIDQQTLFDEMHAITSVANNRLQSVGQIATDSGILQVEIEQAQKEVRSPRLVRNPIQGELAQENAQAIESFMGDYKIDGAPVTLGSYLNKLIQTIPGVSNIDGVILDMAHSLLNHPFAKNLKVEFRSWDNFKDGIENDGSNGKLTRAYVRGDTIVMGPNFKLSSTSDLNAVDSLHVTLLEEVAHRVFGTSIEIALRTARKGELPQGTKGMTKKQAQKLHDDTKVLMDWLRTKTDGKYYHGLLNMHEFWANFASNPRFRKFLNQQMPVEVRRKLGSKLQRAIDWIIEMGAKLFGVDLTPTALDATRKQYRTLLRTADKLAENDVDLMPTGVLESGAKAKKPKDIDNPMGLVYNTPSGQPNPEDQTVSSITEALTTAEALPARAAKESFRKAVEASGREISGESIREVYEGKDHDVGTEHYVLFDDQSGRVLKTTIVPKSMMSFGHFYDVPRYLRDKHNMNVLFGDDIRFEGIVNRDGDYGIVTSQPLIDGREATIDEIKQDLEDRDFIVTEEKDWATGEVQLTAMSKDRTVEISDIAPKNVLMDKGNSLRYIDVHVEATNIEEFVQPRDQSPQFESADTFDDDTEQDASVARGTIRAHKAALSDFGSVMETALGNITDVLNDEAQETLHEYMLFDGRNGPRVVKKILDQEIKSVAEAEQALKESLSPEMQEGLDEVNSVNDLETVTNRDTGARNLQNMLAGALVSAGAKYTKSFKLAESLKTKIEKLSENIARLSDSKSMFDAGKVQDIFARAVGRNINNKTDKGESSSVNVLELKILSDGNAISVTPFAKLRELSGKIDPNKLYDFMSNLADGVGYGKNKIDSIEEMTTLEIFNEVDIKASDIGINDSSLDQAVRASIAIMLGSDGKNSVERSAFTTRLRLSKGTAGSTVKEAVNLIKDIAAGRKDSGRNFKDKSIQSVIKNVRKLAEEKKTVQQDLIKAQQEVRIGEAFMEAYRDRQSDLDEFFEATAPVEIREGGKFDILTLNASGEIAETTITFSLGKGESSPESKEMAVRASTLFKIMDTDDYKNNYAGTPKDRYFKQLAFELRKPNFGIQHSVANVGFFHAAVSSLQERFSRLGPIGKTIASLINEYTREYQAEATKVFTQGQKVSASLRRLHQWMAIEKGENLNQFMNDFGRRLFDWFNERPDLYGQEELAINKVWAELKATDPLHQYTDDGKKALRSYLKQWSIQNENFKRLYKKYNISVIDEDVSREAIATGATDKLYRRFVEQGVFTTPRQLNMSKIGSLAAKLDTQYENEDLINPTGEGKLFGKIMISMEESMQEGTDFNESFTQIMGKSIDEDVANGFFNPYFTGKSAHITPIVIKTTENDKEQMRVVTPEEMISAWTNATGKNPGVRVANAIRNVAKIVPSHDNNTILNIVKQFSNRADVILSAERESRIDRTETDSSSSLSQLMKGDKFHSSIHGRALYNMLPGELFQYEMYDETSSGQYLSKIIMTAKFGRDGEKLTENYKGLREQYYDSYRDFASIAEEAGLPIKTGGMPSKTNVIAYRARKKRMQKVMQLKGIDPEKFNDLDLKARSYVEAEKAFAATNAAFTSRSSNNQDLTTGLEVLRTLAFGAVNTQKGAWTATMSIPDIVKRLGLNVTAFKTVGRSYTGLAREVVGSLMESFGVEMVRPDKYAEHLTGVFQRERGMLSFTEGITEIGRQGTLETESTRNFFRKAKGVINALSMIGGSKRKKTSVNFVPGSILTPFTAPFSWMAQAVNKSIALSMANTIESFVIRTTEVLDARGIDLENNTFEVKPKDLGYEDTAVDSWIFGNKAMVEKLNQRLASEGMSFTQLAQNYRRRRESDEDAMTLTRDGVLAAYNIAMSEVTYDTLSGRGSWTNSSMGQYVSPLVGWAVSSYSKGMDQMRNQEGRMAMRETTRYMITAGAWLVPVGIAFTLFTDWWDEEVLGKPSSLRKIPPVAGVPGLGLPMAMTDPRFDMTAVLERSMRANNVLGIGQEFLTPILVGQIDPSSMANRFEPTRRVLAISTFMNVVGAAMNYSNAIRTSKPGLSDNAPDYATVVRPIMYAMGLNSVVQNTQMITNLTDAEEFDPTGFMTLERRAADITGLRNIVRSHAKVMGMEMRKGGMFNFTTTAMGNAVKAMERAAYANDKEDFKEAYRRAIKLSESEDPRKDIADRFKRRHIRNNITRYSLSDEDMSAILSVLDKGPREKLSSALRNHDFYLRSIGGSPPESSGRRQYSEKLRRLAL